MILRNNLFVKIILYCESKLTIRTLIIYTMQMRLNKYILQSYINLVTHFLATYDFGTKHKDG